MKRTGRQLLAGPRLAGDQHRAPRRPDLADQGLDGLDRRAVADQRVQVPVGMELPPQRLVLQRAAGDIS